MQPGIQRPTSGRPAACGDARPLATRAAAAATTHPARPAADYCQRIGRGNLPTAAYLELRAYIRRKALLRRSRNHNKQWASHTHRPELLQFRRSTSAAKQRGRHYLRPQKMGGVPMKYGAENEKKTKNEKCRAQAAPLRRAAWPSACRSWGR